MWATLLLEEGYHCSGKPQWLRIHLPMQEMWVQSLGQEDPLEEEMATHSSILAWRIMDRGAWWPKVHGVTRVRYDLATKSPPPPTIALHPKQSQEPAPQEACPEHASPPWMIGATPPYRPHTCPYIRAFVLFHFVTACHGSLFPTRWWAQ